MLVVSTTSLQEAVVCLKGQMVTYIWFVRSKEILLWSGCTINYFEIFDLSHRTKTTAVWILYMEWRHRNNFHFPPHLSTHKLLLPGEESKTYLLFFCARRKKFFLFSLHDSGRVGKTVALRSRSCDCIQDAKAFLQLFSLGLLFNPGMCNGLSGSRMTSHGDREHGWTGFFLCNLV